MCSSHSLESLLFIKVLFFSVDVVCVWSVCVCWVGGDRGVGFV